MKLEKILDRLGSLEKNSFIKIVDTIISNNPRNVWAFRCGIIGVGEETVEIVKGLLGVRFTNYNK